MPEEERQTIIDAGKIAYSDLKGNFRENEDIPVVANGGIHDGFWLRDVMHGVRILIVLGHKDKAQSMLDAACKHQREDGMFGIAVEKNDHRRNILGMREKTFEPRGRFISTAPFPGKGMPTDGTSLTLIAAEELKDTDWWNEHFNKNLVPAAIWLASRIDKNGLIRQGNLEDWADYIFYRGHYVLNTNIQAHEALRKMGWNNEADNIRDGLSRFYDRARGVFIDSLDKNLNPWRRSIPTDGNTAAVLTGLADEGQKQSISDFLYDKGKDSVPTAAFYDTHLNPVDWLEKISGGIYSSKNSFGWFGGDTVATHVEAGNVDRAERTMFLLASAIVKIGKTFESIRPDGTPIKNWFTKLFHTSGLGYSWAAISYLKGMDSLGMLEEITG